MKLLSILMVVGSLLAGSEAFALACQNAGSQGTIGRPTLGAYTAPKAPSKPASGTSTSTQTIQ